jgi:cytoskeletal protein CcmA (bactofilin family)
MLNREADNPSRPGAGSNPGPSGAGASTSTYIAPGAKIQGEISGKTEVMIDGELEGQVKLNQLVTVGSQGLVKGEIHAKEVCVSGKVLGNIVGHDRVEVMATGSVEGDIVAPRVTVADGAFLKGKVEMTSTGGGDKSSG